ncbi:GNAT family N-acetyltransferase [Sulfitobacter sp. D35]|uniref:GNAT family N-acetyltransferase n=1 Tax=Sulfitobacter sp. D35 TaxID=3083252 RepID=UPI00296FB260|nr:GNAT family N-acetyltransferase [Sulfitobacter sp. D35]MDW4497387.1 GNAT family N-acetyltransferase [Sulfitobacter sp. D35]
MERALYEALRGDAFYASLEAAAEDPARAHEAMLDYYTLSLDEARGFGRLVTLPPPDAGAALWFPPLADDRARAKAEAKRRALAKAMGDAPLRLYDAINASMARTTSTVTEPTDWYLSILGVDPAQQGRGLGAGLLRPVLEETDRAGVATYLETFTPRNEPFYERLGYRCAGRFDEAVTGASYAVMRRLAA